MQQITTDPAIKLFGQQIPLAENPDERTDKDAQKRNEIEALQEDAVTDEEESESPDSEQHETSKRPDKILACPRCRSADTKFCYYNNYNVKQPRHLCKACQRYWTAGGTMRNVPIGAGRRKAKTSSAIDASKTNAAMLNFKLVSFYAAPAPALAYWNFPSSGSDSPTLGKHSREEGNMSSDQPRHKTQNSCVLVPKTLRIDDPKEAAKSSIWKALGIKNESNSGGGMFKAFQPKGDEKKKKMNHLVEPSPALMANPAALSRSLNFHERS